MVVVSQDEWANMKNFVLIFAAAIGLGLAVESFSSYVMYRYFATEYKGFHPAGSSTYLLLEHAANKLRGRHMGVITTADHAPLYRLDVNLGYAMNPGLYNIHEEYDNQKHVFRLQVTPEGGRATAYRPVTAAHRLFITGDSSIFGWGLNDEETVPWLLQSRLPNDLVINMSLTSYSTITTLIQLNEVTPKISPDDTVVLLYHPLTNDFNIATPAMLDSIRGGLEMQLSNPLEMINVKVPYGSLDPEGRLNIRRAALVCRQQNQGPDCVRPGVDYAASTRVTERAFDEIIASFPAHYIVAVMSAPKDDPVIEHLRKKNVPIADLRLGDDEPDAHDILFTGSHSGPFWHYQAYLHLLAILSDAHLVH